MEFKLSRRDFLKASALLGVACAIQEDQTGFLEKATVMAAESSSSGTDEKIIHSMCVMDHGHCGIDVIIKNGKAEKIYGSKTGYGLARNMGRLCPKGNSGLAYTYDPKRIRYPLKRTGERGEGKWQRISYEEATDIIAAKLLEVRDTYGANTIVTGGWEAPRNWSAYASKFGMRWWSTSLSACPMVNWCASRLTGFPMTDTWGTGWCIDYPNSDLIVHWATDQNIFQDSKAMGDFEFLNAKERGAKLIVISPRFSTNASKADLWIPIKPGYDGALILGMLNTIINENLYDADFVTNWTQGFEELQSYVQEFSPEIVEQITDISAETIRGFARQYATTPRACIFTSRSALGQHSNGIDTLRLLYFLIAITGHIDTPGGNLFHDKKPSLWPTNGSAQSTAIPISSSVNLGQVTRLSSEQPERLSYPVPSRVGVPFPYPDFMWMLFNGEIKALYPTGQNFLGVPNNKVAFEKLREIPFIAVSDLFMTPIADIADVIIPGSSYLERMKVVTTGKYYYGVRVTEPMPNILTEMTEEDASFMLMKKLGLENDFPYSSWEDQINKRELPALGIPITAQEMIEQFPEGLAIPVERKYKKYEDGLIRSDGRPGFDTPSTKFELHSVEAERFGYNPVPKWWVPWELREEEREEYPLILDTAARTWFYGCARSGHINSYNAVSYLSEMVPEPLLILNEQDAYDRGIKDGDWVVVTSRCSSTEVGSIKLKAHIPYPHGDTMPGVCGMYDGFVEALGSNLLPDLSLPEAYDKISGMPPFRGILVEVRKA